MKRGKSILGKKNKSTLISPYAFLIAMQWETGRVIERKRRMKGKSDKGLQTIQANNSQSGLAADFQILIDVANALSHLLATTSPLITHIDKVSIAPSNKLALYYYGKRELVSFEKPRINQSGNNISGDGDVDVGVGGGGGGGGVEGDDDCLEDGYNKEREGEREKEKG
ncbi:Hypothetical predicted protein [Octopus vulgaris]|uniref:Uncharacterized protein n=1 Tax=Octopus vulgaris TaxID=6645 RepID=A0AA36B2F0_OCTVU|nr:Hypothetical predicted protein [Octopus vulgaris]